MYERFKVRKLVISLAVAMFGFATTAGAQTSGPVGEFTGQASVGDDNLFGEARFNNGVYEVLGSGSDIWGTADGFYWVFKDVTGSFIMTVDLAWGDQEVPGGGPTAGDVWKKLGIMVRNDGEEPSSEYVFAMLRNDLAADLQFRLDAGGGAANRGERTKQGDETNVVQLIRIGDTFIMQRGLTGGGFRKFGEVEAPNIGATAKVGLAVTAHNTSNLERGLFSNLKLEPLQDVAVVDVSRSLDKTILDQGGTATVTLTANIEQGKTATVTVTENVPSLLTASNIKTSAGAAQQTGGKIVWNLSGASGSQTLTYTVSAPATSLGSGQFTGSFDIGGKLSLGTGGTSLLGVKKVSSGKTVFFFRNVGTASQSDEQMMLDLQIYYGVDIQVFDDTNAAGFEMPNDLTGANAVYASETVTSGNYAGQLYHEFEPVPQMTGEQALHDDFSFQAGTGNGNYSGNTVEIVDNEHPITQGFAKGPVQIYNSNTDISRLDNPPAGIKVLATEVGNPDRAVLWVVEKDATVNGVTAPAIRIANWLQGRNGYFDATPQGKQLILNAFAYMLGETAPNVSTGVEAFMLY